MPADSFILSPQRLYLGEATLLITQKCFSINLLELCLVEVTEELKKCFPQNLQECLCINDDEMRMFMQFTANECMKNRHGEEWAGLAELRLNLTAHHARTGCFDDETLAAVAGQVAALCKCRSVANEESFDKHLVNFTAHALHLVWLGSPTRQQYPLVTHEYIRSLLRDIHVHHTSRAQKFLLKCIDEALSCNACREEFRKVLHYVRKPYKYITHMASQFGGSDVVRSMLRAGNFVEEVSDYCNFAPLHYALDARREDLALLLLDFDARVDAADSSGREPLHYAAMHGLRTAADLLLRQGASGYARDHAGRTPLDLSRDKDIRSFLRKQMVEAILEDKRKTLMSTLERMAWIAVLLAQAAFPAFMQPPRGLSDKGAVRVEGAEALMEAFWWLDILAFSFSLVTVVLVVALSFPSPKRLSAMGVWLTLTGVTLMLVIAIICGLFAFAAGVMLVFPDKATYVPLSLGVFLVLLTVAYYVAHVVHLYPGEVEIGNVLPQRWRNNKKQQPQQQPQQLVGPERLPPLQPPEATIQIV